MEIAGWISPVASWKSFPCHKRFGPTCCLQAVVWDYSNCKTCRDHSNVGKVLQTFLINQFVFSTCHSLQCKREVQERVHVGSFLWFIGTRDRSFWKWLWPTPNMCFLFPRILVDCSWLALFFAQEQEVQIVPARNILTDIEKTWFCCFEPAEMLILALQSQLLVVL